MSNNEAEDPSSREFIFKQRTFDVYWVDKYALMYKEGFIKVGPVVVVMLLCWVVVLLLGWVGSSLTVVLLSSILSRSHTIIGGIYILTSLSLTSFQPTDLRQRNQKDPAHRQTTLFHPRDPP